MDAAFGAWAGPPKPAMLIVGEAWGEAEEQTHQPFVGSSGIELWRMLGEAIPDIEPALHQASLREAYRLGNAWVRNRRHWLEATGIAYTNVLNLRPPRNQLEALCTSRKELLAKDSSYDLPPISRAFYLQPEYLPQIHRLYQEISMAGPAIVVATGNTACWALLQATNIGSIRGTVAHCQFLCLRGLDNPPRMARELKCLPTYHPAGVLRQWNWRPIVVADLIKAHHESASPVLTRPERSIVINPSLHEVLNWTQQTIKNPPPLLACDIETRWGQISCIGFARSRSEALVVPFIAAGGSYWPTITDELHAWSAVKLLLQSQIPKLFQNGLYDLQYILRMGIRPAAVTEDTMLLHHSLYPELPKGLGFLGSIYTNEAAWKLIRHSKADTEKRDE